MIEERAGGWTVTIASTTVARHRDLVTAILDAGAGVVERDAAEAVAALVARRAAAPVGATRRRS